MPVRKGSAVWEGDLTSGSGTTKFSGLSVPYSFSSRFEEGPGSNPEELIAAAHASCFSMFLASTLAKAGHKPSRVSTTASVHLDKGESGFSITGIDLNCEAVVPGIEEQEFRWAADESKKNCPVSRALAAVEIRLDARLSSFA